MKNHLQGTLFSLMIALFIGLIAYVPVQSLAANTEQFETSSTEAVIENYGSLPLYFEENAGQTDSQVRYFARAGGYSLFLTDNRIAFNLALDAPPARRESRHLEDLDTTENTPTRTYGLYLDFIGANPHPTLRGEAIQQGISNYFKGSPDEWVTDVSHYGAVRYQDLYDGIDAVFYGNVEEIQYDFIVTPHADPSQIRLNFDPVENISLAENGNLHFALGSRTLTMNAPYTYQVIDGIEHAIESHFVLDGTEVTFALGQYDSSLPLIIDPVIVYAGYIGGDKMDRSQDIDIDTDGNAYIIGYTDSTAITFPNTGGLNLTSNFVTNAFIAKVNATGTALNYAGYIGGDTGAQGHSIAVDINGYAYITGIAFYDLSSSFENTFPVIGGPDLTHNGQSDAFVAKVNTSGTALLYAGYIGGDHADTSTSIAVDTDGNVYITGHTYSSEITFPVIGGPDLTHNGQSDAFVAKVNTSGTALLYAGYIGGDHNDYGSGIAVDINGSAYITGSTFSVENTFPVISGPDLIHNGGLDRFVAKVDISGAALNYAGYIGGDGQDSGSGIAVDLDGNAYITGTTDSTETSFPIVGGPDLTHNGFQDIFVTKINTTGTALIYSGYIGGNSTDRGLDIALDLNRNIYITGLTSSGENTFPVIDGPDLTYNDLDDAFVAKVNTAGNALIYSGYIGGFGSDYGVGIAVDSDGNVYITGNVTSRETSFPVIGGPDLTHNGYYDAFVVKIENTSTNNQVFISSLVAQQNDIPSGNWVNLPDNKTFDGNNVQFNLSLTNTYITPEPILVEGGA